MSDWRQKVLQLVHFYSGQANAAIRACEQSQDEEDLETHLRHLKTYAHHSKSFHDATVELNKLGDPVYRARREDEFEKKERREHLMDWTEPPHICHGESLSKLKSRLALKTLRRSQSS